MYFYHNIDNELNMNVDYTRNRQHVIESLKRRFLTYGYEEISTSTFEHYNLYVNMNGTVNHQEMIKTIDNTGQVLVLRPDITIPLTKKIASNHQQLTEHLRYFYVLDVFRQAVDSRDFTERTQAGVEYFGNRSPEADAEIIALAIHILKDVQIENFKIELGHAGFFKQLLEKLTFNVPDVNELITYIEAKNVPELEQFINRANVDKNIGEIISSLPFLYGSPSDVLEKARRLPLDNMMLDTLKNIEEIYQILVSYGVENDVVVDLSLINHMDYYSDLIFQGFVEKVGKPILMGGRYDTLANQFDANIPAIGFAIDIDLLLAGIEQQFLPERKPLDVHIFYEKAVEQTSLQLATCLRERNYSVLTHVTENSANEKATFTVTMKPEKYMLKYKNEEKTFTEIQELLQLLQQFKERK